MEPKLGRRGFLWVTLGFFLLSLAGQFAFGWFVFREEQLSHGQQPEAGHFVMWTLKDMFENWQSEFLQLLWQVGGLAVLLWVGSPQSREGDDRKEAKLDLLLQKAYGKEAERIQEELEKQYPKE